jgi:hypothetical protein
MSVPALEVGEATQDINLVSLLFVPAHAPVPVTKRVAVNEPADGVEGVNV